MLDEKQMTTEQKKDSFNLKDFLASVKSELKKVVWPTRDELVSYTVIVFIAVIFVCGLIWICDTIFGRILNLILS